MSVLVLGEFLRLFRERQVVLPRGCYPNPGPVGGELVHLHCGRGGVQVSAALFWRGRARTVLSYPGRRLLRLLQRPTVAPLDSPAGTTCAGTYGYGRPRVARLLPSVL